MKKKTEKNQRLIELEEKVKDLEDKWKRALADYANLEKRILAEREQFVKFSNASLVDKLLGVLDDLERAETHLKDKGLVLAIGQFRRVLETEGVEEIKVSGEKFDPEAMDCVEITKGPKNIVVEILTKGYKLGDRIIRPAKVKVGKGE
jgi:molecular chaperone GrpE